MSVALESFDEETVLRETEKLLYLYTLKHVIRYGQTRDESDYTESVAEHVFGMHILADYFRPLEDPNAVLTMERVYQLITWHELDEIETGDIPSVRKTDEDRIQAARMLDISLNRLPSLLNNSVRNVSAEYENQSSPEAKYVKAIDKLEPLIHSYHPLGKGTQHQLKLTTESSVRIKEPYIKDFPFIKVFSDTLHSVMDREGYFYTEPTNSGTQ